MPRPDIRRIDRDDELYEQAVDLRTRVLLADVGLTIDDFEREFPGFEARFEHFVAVAAHPKGDRVVGVACLLADYPEAGIGKLMQMAVDPQRQKEGLGRRIVTAVEERAFAELGLGELFCHAQEPAVGFYASLGWVVEGDKFEEAGIPHLKMVVRSEGVPSEAPLGERFTGEDE